MTQIVVLTKEDLDQFKEDLLNELKSLYETNIKKTKWIRTADVREMLNISDSTIQTMRISGTLPAYKLDSTWFYKYDEIIDALEKSKLNK